MDIAVSGEMPLPAQRKKKKNSVARAHNKKQVRRRVKQLMETGEISMSDGPGLTRAAQPAADPDQLGSLAEMHE